MVCDTASVVPPAPITTEAVGTNCKESHCLLHCQALTLKRKKKAIFT